MPRMVGVFAAGRIVNPRTARSQLIGGMTMGLSMALHEEGVMDHEFGGYANSDLAGYHIASCADVGAIDVEWLDEHDTRINPVGHQGDRRDRHRRYGGRGGQRGLPRHRGPGPQPADHPGGPAWRAEPAEPVHPTGDQRYPAAMQAAAAFPGGRTDRAQSGCPVPDSRRVHRRCSGYLRVLRRAQAARSRPAGVSSSSRSRMSWRQSRFRNHRPADGAANGRDRRRWRGRGLSRTTTAATEPRHHPSRPA